MKETANHYETHLTLEVHDALVPERVRVWAESQGMKWTHIVLDGGNTPSQPMVTFWGIDSIQQQQQRVVAISDEIHQRGAAVARVKIEAAVENDDVPQGDSAIARNGSMHFEHHVKVLLAKDSDLKTLNETAMLEGGRLSRNVRRQRTDGMFERFVTQRVYGCGRDAAQRKLDRLLNAVCTAEFQVLEVEAEYVVFDSNQSMDSGWLDGMRVSEGDV